MAFKKFKGRKRTGRGTKASTASIYIHANKRIHLAAEATSLLPVDTKHIELYFDELKQEIGIKPVGEKTAYSYGLHIHGATSRSIWPCRFIDHHKLGEYAERLHPAEWSDEHKMLVVKLDKEALE